MSGKSFGSILLSLLAVNAVILVWLGTRTGVAHPEPLRTGDRIRAITGKRIPSGAEATVQPGRWTMVLYLSGDTAGNQRRLVAAQGLLDRFEGDGLKIAAVASEPLPAVAELIEAGELTYPVLADEDGSVLRQLHLAHPSDAFFLVDEQQRLRFQSRFGSSEVADMRYLVEKHLADRIAYPEDTAGTRISVGKSLPELDLRDLRTGEASSDLRSDARRDSVLVFFTSKCSTCSLGPYMATFRALETRLSEAGRRVVPVFSPLFSPIEVVDHAANLEIASRLLTTGEETLRFVDPSEQDTPLDSDLTVVEVDDEGVVRSIRPLTNVLKEVQL